MLFALSEPVSPSVTTGEVQSQRLPQGAAVIIKDDAHTECACGPRTHSHVWVCRAVPLVFLMLYLFLFFP